MALNESNIDWCTHSTNPFTGCLNTCPYCYARVIAERFKGSKAWPNGFKPTYHPTRLRDPEKLKKPAVIFMGSMTDLFGDWVPYWIVDEIHNEMINRAPWHEYVILTKNPGRMVDYLTSAEHDWDCPIPKNVHYGITLDYARAGHRAHSLSDLASFGYNTVVSFEPLLEMPLVSTMHALKDVAWFIMGQQTSPNVPPPPFAVEMIYTFAYEHGIPLLPKRNLPDISIQFKTCEAYECIINHPRYPVPIAGIMKKWGKS